MVWACTGALAIHLAAAWVLAWPPADGSQGAFDSPHIVFVRYLSEAPSSSSVAEVAAGQGAVGATSFEAATVAQQNVSAHADGDQHHRYFDVSEVDQPAVPTPDWVLDPSMLLRNAVRALKVEVLISETGRPERCTVVSMEPTKTSLYGAIQRQLCSTQLTPAIRHGVAVRSVRHVEIVLSQE